MTTNAQREHHDSTVVKIDASRSPRGAEGEKYLASGVRVSMRLWEEEPVGDTPTSERDYETVGYVISGRAELHVEGQVVRLEPGHSYVVPRGARHHYRILESFTAVEATSPPAQVHGRDERVRRESEGDGEREVRDRVVGRVEEHAALPAQLTGMAVIPVVVGVLLDRLTPGEAHELLEALPPSLRALFERRRERRAARLAARIDRAELVDRVARHLGVTPAHAELVSVAVFVALREELPPKLVDNVAHQLPRDLQDLWLAPAPSGAPKHVPTTDDARQILDVIQRDAELPPGTSAENAFSAVMCALCDRISGGEARDLLLGLPESVRPLLERCVVHRGEPSAVFDRDQLLQRIAAHLGTEPSTAERITRAVFAAVRRVLPEKEILDVASQLPAELVDLWQPDGAKKRDARPARAAST
jgi:uncharacterized protein (DUF2267 family)/quercetin dioxygenase-like cupin family protein